MRQETALRTAFCIAVVTLVAVYTPSTSRAENGEGLQEIKQAAPANPPAAPQETRRLLVFEPGAETSDAGVAVGRTLGIIGSKARAYTTTVTDDASVFRSSGLADYDAVCLAGDPSDAMDTEHVRKLIEYVRGGGGLIGIGSVARGFSDTPEYASMLGGQMQMRLETDTLTLEVEDPYHSCCRMFEEKLVTAQGRAGVFTGPELRETVRVLLSARAGDNRGHLPVSWVQSFGKGRVFYGVLEPGDGAPSGGSLLSHYLAGVQFALGDVVAGTTPSARYGTGYMGDWFGTRESGDASSDVFTRVIARGEGTYRAKMFAGFGQQQGLLAVLEGRVEDGRVELRGKGRGAVEGTTWTGMLEQSVFKGRYSGEQRGTFRLRRRVPLSPIHGQKPPEDATVLFDGKDLEDWKKVDGGAPEWEVLDIGAMEVVPGTASIISRKKFRDAQIHLEFRTPFLPEARGHDRGNSGVYLQGRYEIQILDSYGIEPECGKCQCGSVCYVSAPRVNACAPPMQWQTYDIFFRAPRFDENGDKVADAAMTLYHNGVKVQDGVKVYSPTRAAPREENPQPGGLYLQEHGHAVQFRNIWVAAFEEGQSPSLP